LPNKTAFLFSTLGAIMSDTLPQPKSAADRMMLLLAAGEMGSLCLIKCNDSKTGEAVALLCAVRKPHEDDIEVVPLARMFDQENPFELYIPPLGFDEIPTTQ
jgi:hypothetical protein